MESIEILSVNLSYKKGTIKKPVEVAQFDLMGIRGDAHAGNWHRQISLLGVESLEKMEPSMGRKLQCGELAENLTTQGYPLFKMQPLDRLVSETVELEVTQIGKKCHGEKCAIFRETGDCVMPREGIFCRVIRGGKVRTGDRLMYHRRIIQVGIITLSDRASAGEYEDRSGPLLKQLAQDHFTEEGRDCIVQTLVLPDDPDRLIRTMDEFTQTGMDIIFTTGGTGIGPRDITPDIIRPLLSKELPGIMEMIRVKYGMQFPAALLSRGVAGVMGKTLVYTLPGSQKAVREYAAEIFSTLDHAINMLHAIDSHG